ncbi:FHA domain-containing protein [Bradyrhizobium sp.]|uniref:FHA domain-containing protein n=1 Tax=Bradyrhizobium sp. TaxID=376 RepID=UPI002D388EF4|nr:FHA domain-containing protein [Bradyrhizobium sp.]HZR76401.1 FHA domain-containing protein [Bradyrhizobium sp.]
MIWVEILSRHRDVVSRTRIAGEAASIGRGYDNDVIIDDPYVAARHLRISRDEAGQLTAEDLGTANGIFLDGGKGPLTRLAIDGDAPFRIGQTLLRVRDRDHAVEPERKVIAERGALSTVMVAAMTVIVFAFIVLRVWLAQTGEPRLSNYMTPMLTMAGVLLVWVGIWALVSRLLAGRSQFLRNLMIALVAVLVSLLYNEFAKYAAFGLTLPVPGDYEYAATWTILAAACFLHLRAISARGAWLKATIVVVVLVLAIGAQTLQRSEAFSDIGRQTTARLMLPPEFRTVPLRTPDVFFKNVAGLRADLDADRRQIKPSETTR